MSEALIYAGLFSTIVLLLISSVIAKEGLPLYHPLSIYCVYFFVGFCLRPFAIYVNEGSLIWTYTGFSPTPSIVIYSSFLLSLGLVSFILFPLLISPQLFRTFKYVQPAFEIGNPRRLYYVSGLLFAVGLYGIWAGYGTADSTEVLGYSIDVDAKGGQRLVGVSGYQTAPAEFLPALLLTLFFIFGLSRYVLGLLVAFVILRIWIGAGRNAFVLLGLGMVMISVMRLRLKSIPLKYILMSLVIGFVFDVVGSDRLALRKWIDGDITFGLILENYFQSRGKDALLGDVQEYDVTSVLFSVIPDLTGYNWGSQYLRIIIWPIPRQLWEEKPVYTSLIDLNSIGNFFGLTWTLNADMYSNFGVPSLIAGMACLGFAISYCAWKLAKSETFFARAAYWNLLIYLPILYRDGPPTYVYFALIALIPAYVIGKAGSIRLIPTS